MIDQVLDIMLEDEKQTKKKYYAVMYFYSTYALGLVDSIYEETWVLKKIDYFEDGMLALQAYSSTPCPASQLLEAPTKELLQKKVKEMEENFKDSYWLDKNIRPFI